jgi:hypothetical protein
MVTENSILAPLLIEGPIRKKAALWTITKQIRQNLFRFLDKSQPIKYENRKHSVMKTVLRTATISHPQPLLRRQGRPRRQAPSDSVRVAAPQTCGEAEPLEFWDFGMLCAFDLIRREIKKRQKRGERVGAKEVLQIIAQERETVTSQSLHSFLCVSARQRNPERPQTPNGTPNQVLHAAAAGPS